MSKFPFFELECPVCGRPLHVSPECLGRRVTCQHCHGRLTASDPAASGNPATERRTSLLQRAEQLIEAAALRLEISPPAIHGWPAAP